MKKILAVVFVSTAIILGGCTAAQITTGEQTAEADVQAAVAASCAIIPTLGSIASVALTIAGQSSIAGLSSAAVAAIETDLCSAAPPAASARMRGLAPLGHLPGTIGVSRHGVPVSGWRS